MDPTTTIAWIVAFVLMTVTVTGLSRRAGWSAPVALVAVGAVVSYIPAVPRVEIEPDVILTGLLPPLLFAAAIRTSLIDVRARNDSILTLSVGLVAFTVVVVGLASWLLVPMVSLAAAFAFAAVIAPTDAVAVTAIAGRVGLPRRVVTILEGESLLNDATALVALNASIAAIVSVVTPWRVAGDFVVAVLAGVVIGLIVGYGMSFIRRQLHAPVLDTSLSLVTPYLAFLAAEALHGSGVLAVVITGLYLGTTAPLVQSAEARVSEVLNWRTIQFLLENAVFLFIGLNFAAIVEGGVNAGLGPWHTVWLCFAVLGVLIASRFAWVLGVTLLYRRGPRRLRQRSWSWGSGVAVGAAGIRGVVTLAAVFLLPEDTPGGELLQFLAFVVVVGTLVVGLALPAIIRRLALPPPNAAQEHAERQLLMAEAQAAGIVRLDEETTDYNEERVIGRLRANASFLGDALTNPLPVDSEPLLAAYNRLRRVMILAEREAVLQARRDGRYQEAAVVAVLSAIDAEETALRATAGKADSD